MPSYPLSEPFRRDFIFDEEQKTLIKNLLAEWEPNMRRAKVYSRKHGNRAAEHRTCWHVPFNHKEVFDIADTLKEFTEDWHPETINDFWYSQFEFVRYTPPAQTFEKHQDDNPDATDHNRFFTSVTMVDKSEDLEGGVLRIWLPSTDTSIDVDLEPFETIVFPAYFWHEATPVFRGRRVIMISWGGSLTTHEAERNNA